MDSLRSNNQDIVQALDALRNVLSPLSSDYVSGILTIGSYLVQYGWDYVVGAGTSVGTTKTITYPTAFSAVPICFVTSLAGYKAGSNPSSVTDCTIGAGAYLNSRATSATQGQVLALHRDSAGTLGTDRFVFTWIAIGLVP